ncbi:MAG: Omp28-related outer membrane protein [Bacteroides sp.]|nr:Omp28-related outer membrane protein [Ruminococcus flavefaciens]MCM1553986.1 Omp28-related outer membrane protein [Bacteroides sp.]
MKKLRFLLPLTALSCLFAANAQTRFVSDVPQNRNVLLEEYTAINCGNCPDGHKRAAELMAEHPQQVFLMNVHGTGLAAPVSANEIDLRTAYGEELILQASALSIPTGSLNRHIFAPNTTTALNRDVWNERAAELLAMPSYVNIAAQAILNWETRELSVKVQLYYTGTPSQKNFIHVAVLQDSIIGYQNGSYLNPTQVTPDDRYLHMHVFRDFLTGQWGEEVNPQGNGTLIEKTFTKTLPSKIGKVKLNLCDLQLIAFVSESKEEILNVCPVTVQDVNRPARIAYLSDPVQIAQNTCNKDVRFSVRINNHHLSTEPISSLVLESLGVAESTQHTYSLDRPIPAGESAYVETQPIALAQANRNETLYFSIVSVNGGEFLNRQAQYTEGSAIKHFGLTENPDISLAVQQDRFGSDISWVLKNGQGDTVAQDGPYEDLASRGTELHTYNLHISDACHTFVIHDKQRDGINNGSGEGFVRFTEKNDRIFAELDGKYKDSAVIMLCIGKAETVDPNQPDRPTLPEDPADTIPDNPNPTDTLSLERTDAGTLHIYPNPCRNTVHIAGLENCGKILHIRILSVNGIEVFRVKGNTAEIDVERLPSGLYILEVRTSRQVYRTKLQRR